MSMSEEGQPIPARFTASQRQVIGKLFPNLADRLALDRKHQRTISFTRDELNEIERTALDAIDRNTELRPYLLRNVVKAVRQSMQQNEQLVSSSVVFQFKVTLRDVEPPIWRRIQMRDGTLDKLHENIQCAMGWTNSHLHQFHIGRRTYGDPQLLNDGFDDRELEDSTDTRLSELFAQTQCLIRFEYEYDFGDYWQHEVTFEGLVPSEPGVKYPRCTEGARSCPPEDVGGTCGYEEFLVALRNPKHESHKQMLDWVGGKFDPEAFNLKQTTKLMQKGLPDWRDFV